MSRLLLDLGTSLPSAGKYRLYYAASCPFAHRARMARMLNGNLDDAVLPSDSCVGQTKAEGFFYDPPEPEFNTKFIRDVYLEAKPDYEGKFSVPLLVDRETKAFVNNESIDLTLAFSRLNATGSETNPLLAGMSEEEMVPMLQNISAQLTAGPYKYIFATEQATKDQLQAEYWATVAKWDAVLADQEYALGAQISLVDCVVWPSVVRIDNVYARQFGLTDKTVRDDFPNLQAYLNRIADRYPQILEDLDMPLIIKLYWQSGNLATHCGNDPSAPVPAVIDIFG